MFDRHVTAIANYIFELAQLREKPRSGWELIHIPEKERVASHVLRTAHLAYILAVMEAHPDPDHVALCALFHENDETRLPDMHKVAARYVERVNRRQAVLDQTSGIGEAGEKIFAFWEETEERETHAGIIAKDADYLECAFTAREYEEQGNTFASDWILNVKAALRTPSARTLFKKMVATTSNDWWQGLKKLS